MMFSRNIFYLPILWGAVWLGGIAHADEALANHHKYSQSWFPNIPFQNISIGMMEFKIPTGYVQSYSGQKGKYSDVLLGAIWPDMRAYWLPHQVASDLKSDEAHMGIYASLASSTTSIAFRTDVAKKRSPLPAEPLYGLDHQVAFTGPPPAMIRAQMSDIYYSTGSGNSAAATVISCDFKFPIYFEYPQCQQSIVYARLFLDIGFPKALLPQWRTVDDKVFALISSFVVK